MIVCPRNQKKRGRLMDLGLESRLFTHRITPLHRKKNQTIYNSNKKLLDV